MGNIALGLLGFTLIAFAAKAIAHPEVQARYTPIVVFHAGSMIAWLILLASQSFLAARFKLAAHRATGRASIALVGAMLVSGSVISWRIGLELGRPEVTVVNLAVLPINGVLAWVIELPPAESREIRLGWRVRWPADVEHAAFMVAREALANALLLIF